MTIYASIAHEEISLLSARGEQTARHLFGDAAVDALPRFTKRSKYVGRPKGVIIARRVTRGGWVRLEGRVENRVGQIITADLHELAAWGAPVDSGKVVASYWHGRDAAGIVAHMEAEAAHVLAERAAWFADVIRECGINECIAQRAARAARQ